jgi:hypothetical protein
MQIWRQRANDRKNWVPVVNKAQTLSDCRNEQSVRQARGRNNMMMDVIQNQQCSCEQKQYTSGFIKAWNFCHGWVNYKYSLL